MITGAIVGVVTVIILSVIASVVRKRNIAAATGGAPDAFAFPISPGPPLAEQMARVRALQGQPAVAAKITRNTRPIVTADATGIGISAGNLGLILGIPVGYVTAIEARQASLKPAGLVATNWPTVIVRVRNGDVEVEIGLTPIQGLHEKVSIEHAHNLALQLHARLFPAVAGS